MDESQAVGTGGSAVLPLVIGSSCCLDAERVVSFDLAEEHVAFTVPLPTRAGPGYLRHLTEVRGRLGLAVSDKNPTPAKTEVWVLGDGHRQKWSRRYIVKVQGVRRQQLARPLFAHGDYVLTNDTGSAPYCVQDLFGHRLRDAGRLLSGEVRSVRIREQGTAVSGMSGYLRGTFSYVETTEPLSGYRLGS